MKLPYVYDAQEDSAGVFIKFLIFIKMAKKYTYILTFFSILAFSFLIYFFYHKEKKSTKEPRIETLLEWNKLILELERHTAGYRPPVSARMFAYTGLCAYEVTKSKINLPKNSKYNFLPKEYQSIAPQQYDENLALNATYARILGYFFATTALLQQKAIVDLERKIMDNNVQKLEKNIKTTSILYGQAVADAIWEFAKTDSVGHDAFLFNFDKNFKTPICKGCWQPSGLHPMPALLPYWGQVRTFSIAKNEYDIPQPIPFDEARSSKFYIEAMEVFLASQNKSYEDIWIAEFWADDLPELTVTPVGRWFSIANQCIEQKDFTFEQVLNTYFLLGIGMNDAAVCCWKAKYQYNLERPEIYIQRNIAPNWLPLHDSPPFPAYPSGHATFGALATSILKKTLGSIENITDKTHEDRIEFRGKPRTYPNFDAMAKENAYSRLKIGVHYRMDCEEGLKLGKRIGNKLCQ